MKDIGVLSGPDSAADPSLTVWRFEHVGEAFAHPEVPLWAEGF